MCMSVVSGVCHSHSLKMAANRLFDSVASSSIRRTSGTCRVFRCVLVVFMEYVCPTCLYRDSCLPLRRGTWPNHSCVVAGEENWTVPFLLDHPVCHLL